ncbi:hypothetical protein D5086_028645 [Populus alba]|uniref:Uncharacterized protein n=1 Tax=Populus alba TaxID=43335 RepID=A0ACC4ARE1_POPAL
MDDEKALASGPEEGPALMEEFWEPHFCCTRSSRFGIDMFSPLLNLYEDEKISDLTSRIKTMSKPWTISSCKRSPYLLKQYRRHSLMCVHRQGSDLACDCFIFTFISGNYKLGEKCKSNLVSAKALLKPDNNNGASEESQY